MRVLSRLSGAPANTGANLCADRAPHKYANVASVVAPCRPANERTSPGANKRSDSSSISCSKPGARARAHDGAVHLGVGARCLDVQQRQRSVLCLADRL